MAAALAFAVAGFTWLALVTYTVVERRHRMRWRDRTVRGESRRRVLGPRASVVVRGTSLLSLLLAPMALPSAFVGAWSFAMGHLGLVSLPSVLLTLRTCGDGLGLLRGDPRSITRARTTAGLSLFMNAGFVVPTALMLALTPADAVLGLWMLACAALSLAHAGLLRVSSGELERLWLSRGYSAAAILRSAPERAADERALEHWRALGPDRVARPALGSRVAPTTDRVQGHAPASGNARVQPSMRAP